jgi:hypothetical protein
MATRGGRISLPLAVGVDRGHPNGWIFFFFFFSPEKSSERVVGGGICSPEVDGASGGVWVDLVG